MLASTVINDIIENFYREKPLHFLNTVVQTPTSTNYYQGVNSPGVKIPPLCRTLKARYSEGVLIWNLDLL